VVLGEYVVKVELFNSMKKFTGTTVLVKVYTHFGDLLKVCLSHLFLINVITCFANLLYFITIRSVRPSTRYACRRTASNMRLARSSSRKKDANVLYLCQGGLSQCK